MAWRALLSIRHVCLSEQHTASTSTVLFALEGVRLVPTSGEPRDRVHLRNEAVTRYFMGGSCEQSEHVEKEGLIPNWARIQPAVYSFTS